MGRVVGEGVPLGDRAGGGGGHAAGDAFRPLLDQGADLGEAGVLADRGGARPAHLDAVVPRRIVRGREHRPGEAEGPRRVVQLVRRAEADERDVRAPGRRSPGERTGESWRRGAHVVADHDRVGGRDLDERGSEEFGQRFVPLVGHHSAHVVRLHELRQISNHGRSSWGLCGPPKLPGRSGPQESASTGGLHRRSSAPVPGAGFRWAPQESGERSTLRCPRRATSTGSAERGPRPPPSGPRSCGRAASRTALARASRSSPLGCAGAEPSESRTTSQPRGAVSRSLCSAQRS